MQLKGAEGENNFPGVELKHGKATEVIWYEPNSRGTEGASVLEMYGLSLVRDRIVCGVFQGIVVTIDASQGNVTRVCNRAVRDWRDRYVAANGGRMPR